MCVSAYQKKGVTYLVVMEDQAPAVVIENLCPVPLEFGQAANTGSSKGEFGFKDIWVKG